MSDQFKYLDKKIMDAGYKNEPFPHLLIDDFLSSEHLDMIIKDPQVKVPVFSQTEDLIDYLMSHGYAIQAFPGCIVNKAHYLNFLETGEVMNQYKTTEGVGFVLRLKHCANPEIEKLLKYLNGQDFHDTLRKKFEIERKTKVSMSIQKYFTGYEISPHPDVTAKCLTYLVNINTDSQASNLPIHTYLFTLNQDKELEYNKQKLPTRSWIPWDWATINKEISQNNALLMFKVQERSLHGVKLDYDHLPFQRTQLYGNLYYY